MTIARRFPAFASRDFRIFWVGQFISLIGTWMQNTVLPYLAYRLTGQPLYLGLIGFAATLPPFFLTLPGGVLVERLDRRKVVIVMQTLMMIQAFVLAFLTLAGKVTIWHIIGLSFVLGLAGSLEIVARQAMLIELVGKEALPNAIALQSSIFNAARVLGPMAAAPFMLLLSGRGEGWAFMANGFSFLVVIIGLFFVRSHSLTNINGPRPSPMAEFREGQRYISRTPVIVFLIAMVGFYSFFGITFAQQIPVFARDVLKQIGDTEAAIAARNSLLVTAQGVGALIAAVWLATFSEMPRKGLILTIGQFVFAAALTLFSFTQSPAIASILLILIGLGAVTHLAMTNILIQMLTPNELRSRVLGTFLWVFQGAAPFGSLFIGWLAQQYGASNAVLVGGLTCLLSSLLIHIKRPDLRRLEA